MDASTAVADVTPGRVANSRPHGSRLVALAAVSGWGAGLILLALGAGALTAGSSAAAAGVGLVALGASGIAGGAMALARGRIVVPRAGVATALAALLVTALALVLDPARTSVTAVAAASVLIVAYALTCASSLRREDGRRPRAVSLATLLVTGIVVAGIVTPALSATEAALLAPHDGEPVVVVDPHRH